MTTYINTNTNQYPYYIGNLCLDYPEYNVYQPLPEGVFPVTWVNEPEAPDVAHYYVPKPVEKDGEWIVEWNLEEREPGTYCPGPGFFFDEESGKWYPQNPTVKAYYPGPGFFFNEESGTWVPQNPSVEAQNG
jgi:hypothetical protein